MSLKHKQTAGTFHLEKISGNFGWELNGKRFFDSFHRKIPGKGRTSKQVSPFFRLERSERIFVFHYHVTRISCQFQVHRKKFASVILGKSGLSLSGSVYNLSFQWWLHEIAFKSWVPFSWDRQVPGVWKKMFKCSSSLWLPAIIGTFCWHAFRAFSFFRQSLHRF